MGVKDFVLVVISLWWSYISCYRMTMMFSVVSSITVSCILFLPIFFNERFEFFSPLPWLLWSNITHVIVTKFNFSGHLVCGERKLKNNCLFAQKIHYVRRKVDLTWIRKPTTIRLSKNDGPSPSVPDLVRPPPPSDGVVIGLLMELSKKCRSPLDLFDMSHWSRDPSLLLLPMLTSL